MGYAELEARLGAVTLVRFGNASLTVLPGGNVVQGMFDDAPREALIGGGRAQAHEMTFSCAISDAAALQEKVAVTLNYRGQAIACRIAERLPDDVHLQHAVVALARRSTP